MAEPISYLPPVPEDTGARDEVDDLVQALHESGLLRVMAGGARAYPQLLRTLLQSMDANALRSAIELGGALRDLDPDESARVAAGVRQARADAVAAASGRPEGPLALLRRLRDPDTRRGIAATLAALAAIGRSLPRS
ncbi:hypothetical protein GCM10011519_19230 [Marmoricola endophyticus]|uniref:DUF1641 domain-containing protein n=1 Tax=Marmoricola endophyticus TaxID=2040280 RepID=A0A917BJL1_9ACTN|nr:DUF1641 domain-containing protein [Marmoricola endophyticus]GGF45482.1 hypothetical protein GCM10011519_19230 [Marmoricola endophyticus]